MSKLDKTAIRYLARGILRSVYDMHNRRIIHRDLKRILFIIIAANILIGNNWEPYLTDFGSAIRKSFCDTIKDGNKVVTLWYRAPELLLKKEEYNEKIDMWSVGCILIEFYTKVPYLRGREYLSKLTETDSGLLSQLDITVRELGRPTNDDWPGVEEYNNYQAIKLLPAGNFTKDRLTKLIPDDPQAVDLISKLLVFNPEKRFSAEEALNHQFFYPKDLKIIPPNMYINNYN